MPTGRLVIDFVLMVVDDAADVVWMISVAPVTTTVSVRPPTSSTTRTVRRHAGGDDDALQRPPS